MKFRVQMKDPDTLHDAIKEAVDDGLASSGLPEDEQSVLAEKRIEKIGEIASKWFRYGEYLEVEIDTEAKTCIVIEQ